LHNHGPCSSSAGSPPSKIPTSRWALPLAEIVALLQDGVGHLLRQTGLALGHSSVATTKAAICVPGRAIRVPGSWHSEQSRPMVDFAGNQSDERHDR